MDIIEPKKRPRRAFLALCQPLGSLVKTRLLFYLDEPTHLHGTSS